jgi:outer membrane protein assembly factor BamB
MRVAATAIVVFAFAAGALAESFPLPEDAASVDVTKPPYSAVGDGKTDCMAAFQKAMNGARKKGAHGLIYVPNGTYLVGTTQEQLDAAKAKLKPGQALGGLLVMNKKITLWGQDRDKTIIKLADNCPSFTEPAQRRYVLDIGGAGATDFFCGMHHITMDIGKGNAGATAVKFHTSNQGSMTDVLIRSGDGTGAVGLDLTATSPGPGLCKNIRIEGFDTGISIIYHGGFSMVFENIELIGQRKCGFYNDSLPCAIRGLKSTNTVTALRNAKPHGFITLVDASLTGGAADANAIENLQDGGVFCRNVEVAGYGKAIRSSVDGQVTEVAGPKVDEWTSHAVRSCIPNAAARSLGLPVEDAPSVPWGDVSTDWVSVRQFEPQKITIKDDRGRDKVIEDWSPAIQKAIDSGKPTVYFPNGIYQIAGPIIVRGKVQRIFGSQALLQGVALPEHRRTQEPQRSFWEKAAASVEGGDENDDDQPADDQPAAAPAAKAAPATSTGPATASAPARQPAARADFAAFTIAEGQSDTVIFEDLITAYGNQVDRWFDHASKRTVVIRRCSLGGYQNSVPGGKVFLEDNCVASVTFDHQKVWMRQWNPEAKSRGSYNCVNKGSDLWILGVKTEGPKIVITTIEGGQTEVLGGDVYPNRGTEGNPAFVCVDGRQSLSYSQDNGWISPNALYEEQVREIRGEKIYSTWRGDVPKRGGYSSKMGGAFVPLYVGYEAAPGQPVNKPPADEPVLGKLSTPFVAGKGDDQQLKAPIVMWRGPGRTGEFAAAAPKAAKDGSDTAKPRWTVKTDREPGPAVVAGGVAYFGDHRNNVYAVNIADGSIRWKAKVTGDATGAPAVAYNMVYIGSGDDFVAVAVVPDAEGQGKVVWQIATGAMTCFEPAVSDGLVISVNARGDVYGVDAISGSVKYKLSLNREAASGVALEGNTAFVGFRGGVQAFEAATGKPLWRFRCGASVNQPIVTGGTLYAAADKLYAVDTATGNEKWSKKIFKPTDPRIGYAEGVLYMGAPWARGVWAVSAADGSVEARWDFDLAKYHWNASIMNGPAVAGGVLYFYQQNGWFLVAADARTGKLLYTADRSSGLVAGCTPADGGVLSYGAGGMTFYE